MLPCTALCRLPNDNVIVHVRQVVNGTLVCAVRFTDVLNLSDPRRLRTTMRVEE